MRISSFVVLLGALSLAACGGETTPPPAVDGGVPTDLGGGETDARVICTSDVDCNDGLFCNGREMCAPASTTADVRGCTPGDAPCSDTETCDETANDCRVTCEDLDGDGHEAPGCGGDDCDDADASRYPGNAEVCNATDEDCNDATLGFVDADGDGVASSSCCNGAACGGDCNDGNADVRPGALDGPPDLCNTIDDDCDGSIDEGCPCTTGTETPCYTGAASTRGIGRCADGFQLCVGGMLQDTCNDQLLPDTEICDTLDNDCDGMTNEDVLRRYYRDGDADGFGLATESIEACSPPAGYVAGSNDCADDDANRNPGAFDGCNSVDDDCDGTTDEGAPPRTFHPDTDGDGFGATGTMMSACEPPAGYILDGTDCDDSRAGRHPGAFDACNMLDDDCDGATDESAPPRVFHRDADGDGFGAVAGTMTACDPPAGHVLDGSDCDDTDSARHPGAYERCDAIVPPATASVDDDCDTAVNEGCTCTEGRTQDCGPTRPAVGACVTGTQVCIGGVWGSCSGAVASSAETCNGRDDDCDGSTDELVSTTCYADADDDGRGAGLATQLCGPSIGTCPAGWSTLSDDCNDSNGSISPSAVEACNGRDDDCDPSVDEGFLCAQGATRAGSGTYLMCPSIAGLFTCNATCNGETFTTAAPPETCNGADENCNGVIDDGFACARSSTGNACVTSCGTAGTYTCSATCTIGACRAATETCNACDDDGDGMTDEGFACVRGATRAGTGAYLMCPSVAGTYTCNAICTGETFSSSAPPETCNGADDNCNGVPDDGFACVRSSVGNACVTTCGTAGTYACSATCTTGACVAATETCNACDDDGDGMTDEGFACVRGVTRAGTGAYLMCPSLAGLYTCNAACTGETFSTAAPPETCDGADNNCNGAADDGFACVRSSAGNGCTTTCGTVGAYTCTSSCTIPTGSTACRAATETCNGCDDDGDAIVDDGFACVRGATRSGCTNSCGATIATNVEACRGDCTGYETCRSTDEGPAVGMATCNGCDDDLDGIADEGFACVAGRSYDCITACGTTGRRTCSATCTLPACYAAGETCNYCDDTGNGTFQDDAALATNTAQPTLRCGDGWRFTGGASCSVESTGGLDSHYVNLGSTGGYTGTAAWRTAPLRMGWGTMRVRTYVQMRRNPGAYPGEGFAIVLSKGGSGDIGGAGEAGVPLWRRGLAFVWRFWHTDWTVNETDRIDVRRLDGTGIPQMYLGAGATGIAEGNVSGLDWASPDTYPGVTRTVDITYTTDDPRTPGDEEALAVQVDGTTEYLWSGPLDTILANEFVPGDNIEIGLVSSTGGYTHAVRFQTERYVTATATWSAPNSYYRLSNVCL